MVSIVGSKRLNTILAVAAVFFVLAITFLGLVSRFQERIAFQPEGPPYPVVDDSLRVEYSAADGQRLLAYVIDNVRRTHGLLLAFHGNADLAARQIDWAEEVARRTGLAVMIAEYRGYGGLAGKPGYAESQLDADAAYRFAREQLGVPSDRIAFFGHSLGTAVATELAERHPPSSLLLQSPFTSARDMARVLVGRHPSEFTWNRLSRIHFNTLAKVKSVDAPVSVAHGAQDRLIPISMGRQVFDAARSKGAWLVVPNAAHNDVALRGGEPYWQWISQSLALRADSKISK